MDPGPERPLVAIDDGYFPARCKGVKACKTVLAAVLFRGKPLDLCLGTVLVDGDDALDLACRCVNDLLNRNPYVGEPLLMLDNVTFAGFNVVDVAKLRSCVNGLVVAVYFKSKPDVRKIERALKRAFREWRSRYEMFLKAVLDLTEVYVPRSRGRFYLHVEPRESLEEALELIQRHLVFSTTPEPIRVAHLVASAASRYLLAHAK